MNEKVREADILSAIPIPSTWTRTQKLNFWAELVRQCTNRTMQLNHMIEHWNAEVLDSQEAFKASCSAGPMGLAADNAQLVRQGLTTHTVRGIMNFFEISQADLHAFSCDCGGFISNTDMADRIQALASQPAPAAAKPAGFMNTLRRLAGI